MPYSSRRICKRSWGRLHHQLSSLDEPWLFKIGIPFKHVSVRVSHSLRIPRIFPLAISKPRKFAPTTQSKSSKISSTGWLDAERSWRLWMIWPQAFGWPACNVAAMSVCWLFWSKDTRSYSGIESFRDPKLIPQPWWKFIIFSRFFFWLVSPNNFGPVHSRD